MFDPAGEAMGHIKAGKLRGLAVTSATRLAALPVIPTVGDFVPGYEAEGWSGMGAPKNTPVEIIDTLNRLLQAANPSHSAFALASLSLLASLSGKRSSLLQSWLASLVQTWSYAGKTRWFII